MKKLFDLIEGLDVVGVRGDTAIPIDGIAYNSGRVGQNHLFVAIDGFRRDGHGYIDAAIAHGATAVVVSREVAPVDGVTFIRVGDSRVALSRLSTLFYDDPTRDLDLVAVTGTNGKTSTTCMLNAILESAGVKTGSIGTLGTFIEGGHIPNLNTTPESLELCEAFSRLREKGCAVCTMEVSSHSIELKRVMDCRFNISLFTNLTHEHLDFHDTMEDYYRVKRKLFLQCDGTHIINADDPYGRQLIEDLQDHPAALLTYGMGHPCDVRAEEVTVSEDGSRFTLKTAEGAVHVRLPLPGRYNIFNALAAAASAVALGIALPQIKGGLEAIESIPGRYEVIPLSGNDRVIIDYAHTPDAFENLLNTVRETATGRIVMVFGCVGERDPSKRGVMGEVAGSLSDFCVLTTDNCRSECPETIIGQIAEGVRNVGGHWLEIVDRREAIRHAILNRQQNDTILITGKGHETKQHIGDDIFFFDEREIVSACIGDGTKYTKL